MNKIQSKHEPNSPKARKLSACEVEKKLNDIMATVDNEADLQNKLLFLLDDIGLPKDSADQYSRRLSYSEAYERIREWIREANAQRRVKIMVWTACISAASALIAITFSFYTHHATRQLLRRTERPIIALIDSKCTSEDVNSKKTKIGLALILKNIGKNPAENIKLRVYFTLLNKPEQLTKAYETTSVNVWDPEYSHKWTATFSGQGKSENPKVFMCVRITYFDHWQPTKEYERNFFCVYQIGSDSVSEASYEIKKRFQPYLDKVVKE